MILGSDAFAAGRNVMARSGLKILKRARFRSGIKDKTRLSRQEKYDMIKNDYAIRVPDRVKREAGAKPAQPPLL